MIQEKLSSDKIQEIKELARQDLTQRDIAENLNISLSTVNRYLKPKQSKARVGISHYLRDEDVERICDVIIPLIRQKLNGEGENRGKEEQPMSEEDVAAKVRRQMEQDNERKKVAKDVAGLKDDMKGVKDFCKRFPELCQHLEQKVDGIEQKPAEPKHLWLGAKETKHADLPDLLGCCDSDDPKSCSTNLLCDQIPASLKAKMLRLFCTNEACIEELKKQGFQLDGEGYRKQGSSFLGG